MPIKAHEIMQVAESLAERDGEAAHRSAASRAYYAAFLSARDVLPEEFTPYVKSGSSHDAVIDSLLAFSRATERGRTEAVQIAADLPRLKKKRKLADYGLENDFFLEDAINVISRAKKIIGHCLEIERKIGVAELAKAD
jgi:uncharacterized protein (UPF0332 family)